MGTNGTRVQAVVFDLLYTLVHPGTYPAGNGRVGWLAEMLGVDPAALDRRWADFEPVLESGRAPGGADGLGPELTWVRAAAADLGVAVPAEGLARIDADWDLTRRTALLDPPSSNLSVLIALRDRGIRLGVLSNTHPGEMRAWARSPLAPLIDVVAFSHDIGVCKPDTAAYAHVLQRLGVPAAAAAYVGDGSSDELVGARAAGFGLVVLAEEAPARLAAGDLRRLRAQADASVASLADLVALIDEPTNPSHQAAGVDGDPGPGWALAHYALGKEKTRLLSGPGLLERERTRELLLRYLPAAPAGIADIGAGAGAHSLWLAELGYDVVARDLVLLHVEQLVAAAERLGLTIDAGVADARRLDLPTAAFDVALVLGPLYHLAERDGRIRSLQEAARVVRPGGVVAVAAISPWAVLADGILLNRIGEGIPGFAAVLDAAMETGLLEPLQAAGFSAFCHRPHQLREEIAEAGLLELALFAIEGPGAYLADLEERWATPASRETVLDVARRLESVPEMLGMGPHLLLIATRQ